MTKILKEGDYSHDVVKYENPEYSREIVTIPSGTGKLVCGTVLKTDSNGYVPVEDNQTDVACAVLLQDVDATSADIKAVVVARHAIVVDRKLVFNFETSASRAHAISSLESVGIVTRKGA